MTRIILKTIYVPLLLYALIAPTRAADLVALSPQTWDRYIPQGKEVDGIYGDFAMANDQLVAVIAIPDAGPEREHDGPQRRRMPDRPDAPRRPERPAFGLLPRGTSRDLKFAGIEVEAPTTYETAELDRVFVRARKVTLKLVASPRDQTPDVEVAYTLEDGQPFLMVTTMFANRGGAPLDAELLDAIRADRTFEHGPDQPASLFWAYDKHFGQAYGVAADGMKSSVATRVNSCSATGITMARWLSGWRPASPIGSRGGSFLEPTSSTSAESPTGWPGRPTIPFASR